MSSTSLMLLLGIGMVTSWSGGLQQAVVTRGASGVRRAASPRAMFSGIVEEMGTVKRLEKVAGIELWDGSVGEGWEMEVDAKVVLEQASLGCSIAVNGVCLTVTEFDEKRFAVGLAPETIRRTNLVNLKAGDPINLERALAADGRNSGHFVQGHVDDVGIIEELRPDGDSLYVKVRPDAVGCDPVGPFGRCLHLRGAESCLSHPRQVKPPARLMPYIVPKGFIAVDGTSLTVCEVDYTEGWFNFMLVAYTQQKIIIPNKPVCRVPPSASAAFGPPANDAPASPRRSAVLAGWRRCQPRGGRDLQVRRELDGGRRCAPRRARGQAGRPVSVA